MKEDLQYNETNDKTIEKTLVNIYRQAPCSFCPVLSED